MDLELSEDQLFYCQQRGLDEEAADLVRYQQAYQAAAKIIQTSQDLFDAVLAI